MFNLLTLRRGQLGNYAATQMESAALAATQAGMVVFAASGDNDSSDGGQTPANVDVPSACPHVIGCGGAKLKRIKPSGTGILASQLAPGLVAATQPYSCTVFSERSTASPTCGARKREDGARCVRGCRSKYGLHHMGSIRT